jgi:hypothetical protein
MGTTIPADEESRREYDHGRVNAQRVINAAPRILTRSCQLEGEAHEYHGLPE